MKPHTQRGCAGGPLPPPLYACSSSYPPEPALRLQFPSRKLPRHVSLSIRSRRQCAPESPADGQTQTASRRRVLLTPLLALGASVLQSATSKAADVNKSPESSFSPPTQPLLVEAEEKAETAAATAEISSRIYDAAAIGEPMALGKDKRKMWEKLMNARIVYLGEAEQVPVKDDKELELEIVENLRKRCVEREKSISLAMEAFPCDLQQQLNQYMNRRIVACGTPLKVIRTVQAEGIRGLSMADRKLYAPPAGSGFISGFTSISRRSIDVNSPNQSVPFGPSSYLSAQAK
ncbi:hypothetical protein GH714_013896 [Hevea brasiliensis]|uniref:Haem-binding uptake Tiki superfamily ChaN domain-containing protein n=1 Tax=Hevea brasiliensis TaxID=3981 RepID=A0A6A6N3P9_HEVBR|nr:hypothetical protein GH714_013896 [Hevea brasiliensis]